MEITLRALGVAGREVVVPANTFFATAAAVLHAGATPRFADVAEASLALTAETVEAALTPRTAGVIIVHVGGMVAPDVVAIRELCDRRGLFLVEDAAHAHGSSLGGRSAGTFGVAGTFSFYPTKVITAGEGGMIITADDRLREEAVVYRDQGKAGFLGGEHIRLGYAWRMSEIHAAIASVHLRRLDQFIATRAVGGQAAMTRALLDLDGITPILLPDQAVSNYYKYVALLDRRLDRADVKAALRQRGVSPSGEVYATPLHREPVFAQLATPPLPVAEDVCARQLCLPIHSDMTDAEVDYVLESLAQALDAVQRPEGIAS